MSAIPQYFEKVPAQGQLNDAKSIDTSGVTAPVRTVLFARVNGVDRGARDTMKVVE
jgi:hypothetical protein